MSNKKTRAIDQDEFTLIINTMLSGFINNGIQYKPNTRIAALLTVQANLGMRIGDILNLTLNSIIRDSNRYRLNIVEEKTKKQRTFTVPVEVYAYIQSYAIHNNIKLDGKLFPISIRQVEKHLQYVAQYLRLENISTHSSRKFYAMSLYNNNGFNIELVRQMLQHSSVSVTQHYLSISSKQIEDAIQKHIYLPTA